jgi:hypothetical protein
VIWQHQLGVREDDIPTRDKKEKSVIGQYRLYLATTGSKPISPVPTTIPIKQMLYFVILNDMHFIFV